MPNHITHNYFGQTVANILTGKPREIVSKFPEAFKIGALGPDFMFVLREMGIGNAPRYANEMQYKHMHEVFEASARYIAAHYDDCFVSYMLGLLCHYVIDMRGHAYVNYFLEEVMPKFFPWRMQSALHPLMEAGLDQTVLIEYMKVNPVTYDPGKELKPSRYEVDKIAELYVNVINGIIGFEVPFKMVKRAIRYTLWFLSFTRDLSGRKKKFFDRYEDKREIKKQLSSSIRPPHLYGEFDYMNRKRLPWRAVRNRPEMTDLSFDMLMDECREQTLVYVADFMAALSGSSLDPDKFRINYEGVDIFPPSSTDSGNTSPH